MRTRIITLMLLCTVAFAACKKTASHADNIPADATAVLAINTDALGKKIAWNALWGSKLFNDMKQQMNDSSMMKELENSGIETMTTYYAYARTDSRYNGGNRLTAVIPLDDAAKWEAFVKKQFPNVAIKQQKDRKEALLGSDVYIGWNSKLLIVMNTIYTAGNNMNMAAEDMEALDSMDIAQAFEPGKPDEALMVMEMEKAFTTSKDAAVTANKNFVKLQEEAHDISLWVNYEPLMAYSMQNAGGMAGGLATAGSLWKDAAMAMGVDFEKGKIASKIRYYVSQELKDAAKELGKENADKEMIDRLPAHNLNLIAAAHISTKGIKKMLEKMNLIGFANIALAQKGLTADDIVEAISGDMAISVNDFRTYQKAITTGDSTGGQQASMNVTTSDANYVYVLKIGKKEKFDKLLQMALADSLIRPLGNDRYMVPVFMQGDINILINKEYLVVSNKAETVDAYVAGTYKGQKFPEAAKQVYGHPGAMYFDVKSMLAGVDATNSQPQDAAMLHNARSLVSDVIFTGGNFKDGHFEYDMSVNFINKDENSLLLLLDFANKMKESSKTNQVAFK